MWLRSQWHAQEATVQRLINRPARRLAVPRTQRRPAGVDLLLAKGDQRSKAPIASSSARCRKPVELPGAGLLISSRKPLALTGSKVRLDAEFDVVAHSVRSPRTGTQAPPSQ